MLASDTHIQKPRFSLTNFFKNIGPVTAAAFTPPKDIDLAPEVQAQIIAHSYCYGYR